jgi:16S rRNA (uracil1498-N3)-methyltransferase
VFVADVTASELELDPRDRHHLERVLRLRPGETVIAADGLGAWRFCSFRPGGTIEAAAPVSVSPKERPEVTVAFALTKGERPEWTVQKLAELGVDRIVPMLTARCVVRWEPQKAPHHLGRLREIARQAAMQSRRPYVPVVEDICPFVEVATAESGLALAVPGGAPPSLDHPGALVGPEGGWSDEEESAGLPTMGFGTGVLRSETAAVAAGAILCGLRAGVVAPAAGHDA